MPTWVNLDTTGRPTTGGTLLTAWGTQVNDDMNFLAGTAGATVAANQTTASTAYVDLATVGPQVPVTTGANALVIIGAAASNNTGGNGAFMSVQVTGASAVSPGDGIAFAPYSSTGGFSITACNAFVITGLTPGVNNFIAKYRVVAGTGAWASRFITVIPLP